MTQSPAIPSSTRRRVFYAAIGIVALGIACTAIQLTANLSYDDALLNFESLAEDAEHSHSALVNEISTFDAAIDSADSITVSASTHLMDASLKEELVVVLRDAESTTAQLTAVTEQQIPQAVAKQEWAWELFGATAQLNADRETATRLIASFDSASNDAASAVSALEDAGSAALTSAATAAEAFESEHVSARNPDIVALRVAAQQVLDAADTLDSTASAAYSDLENAAVQMLASEHAELFEKAGPLNDSRIEVEAFARSLAPGLLLDFDWSPLVNDFGHGDSMGGYATWWFDGPGYANIELSNSVAEYWPSDRSKALVAHEVGHAISVRCDGMYDDSSQENIEDWATAWAISMGYLSASNGTASYGAPPQELIDAAAGCR
ncbi:hypothetical protein [Microbacterium sp. A84]|uniref:hypothetical protein n=1 Tax=Microbacterium sp. A84 TaxID=3450715 RepID=UPI003F43B275